MNYKEICPPFLYYLSIFLGICCLLACAYIFNDMMMHDPVDSRHAPRQIIISLFGMLLIYLTVERTNKYVYARLDLEKKTMIYGNAFFRQEVQFKVVKFVKPGFFKRIFERKTYKVTIGNQSYFIYYPSNENLEAYFSGLISGSV